MQKAQQVPSVMLQADAIQQSLVVFILETSGTQVIGDFLFDSRGSDLEVASFAGTLVAPQLARLPQQALQFQSKAAGPSGLGFQRFVDIAIEMVQAFLLLDPDNSSAS